MTVMENQNELYEGLMITLKDDIWPILLYHQKLLDIILAMLSNDDIGKYMEEHITDEEYANLKKIVGSNYSTKSKLNQIKWQMKNIKIVRDGDNHE